jgi:hypothetical protein
LAADTQMALEKGLHYRDQVERLIGELDDVTRERDRLAADNARLSGIYIYTSMYVCIYIRVAS